MRRHRYTIISLWSCFNAEGDPAEVWKPADQPTQARCRRLLDRCHRFISTCPGSSMLACVDPGIPRGRTIMKWSLRGDAAIEDGDPNAGLGGHLYNRWSYLKLTDEMRLKLAISHLEFVQLCMNFITHARALWHVQWIELECDALATPTTLEKCDTISDSACMETIHKAFLDLVEVKHFLHPTCRLTSRHVWGDGNQVADAASRAENDRLERHFAQLGMTPVYVPYSDAAMAFLRQILDSPAFTKRARERSPPCDENPADAGGTAYKHLGLVVSAGAQPAPKHATGKALKRATGHSLPRSITR